MSEHYIKHCAYCDTVISQCRCPGPKKLQYGVCAACYDKRKYQKTPDEPFKGYSGADITYAQRLCEVLNDYYDGGNLVDLNADVLINRVGSHVFGERVWDRMMSELVAKGVRL